MDDSMKRLQTTLSKCQAQLFVMSGKLGYNSEIFIKTFMKSAIAKGLDSKFDFMQWCGKEYMMERFQDEYPEGCIVDENTYDEDILYWIGYVYRRWNYYTDENSKQIYKIANAKLMRDVYLGYHTFDVHMAIDRLKEMRQKKKSS